MILAPVLAQQTGAEHLENWLVFTHYAPTAETTLRGSIESRVGYGVFRWWPEGGESWIHPYDVGIVRHLVPGHRVFRREDLDGRYLLISYGKIAFRARSSLWMDVEHEGFDIGDSVQIMSQFGQNFPFVGHIRDMFWDENNKRIEYHVGRANQMQPGAYLVDQFRRVDTIVD